VNTQHDVRTQTPVNQVGHLPQAEHALHARSKLVARRATKHTHPCLSPFSSHSPIKQAKQASEASKRSKQRVQSSIRIHTAMAHRTYCRNPPHRPIPPPPQPHIDSDSPKPDPDNLLGRINTSITTLESHRQCATNTSTATSSARTTVPGAGPSCALRLRSACLRRGASLGSQGASLTSRARVRRVVRRRRRVAARRRVYRGGRVA
jgi:hypothetical protein